MKLFTSATTSDKPLKFKCIVHNLRGFSDDGRVMFQRQHISADDLEQTFPLLYGHKDESPSDVIGSINLVLEDAGLVGYASMIDAPETRRISDLIGMGVYGVSCGVTFYNADGSLMDYSTYRELKPTDNFTVKFSEVSVVSKPADKKARIMEQSFIQDGSWEAEPYGSGTVDVGSPAAEHVDVRSSGGMSVDTENNQGDMLKHEFFKALTAFMETFEFPPAETAKKDAEAEAVGEEVKKDIEEAGDKPPVVPHADPLPVETEDPAEEATDAEDTQVDTQDVQLDEQLIGLLTKCIAMMKDMQGMKAEMSTPPTPPVMPEMTADFETRLATLERKFSYL